MATSTYDLLESVTLATAASSVTFSSIDQSYGDLIIVITAGLSSSGEIFFYLNSDTGSNYNWVSMYGLGGSDGSVSDSNSSYGRIGQGDVPTGVGSSVEILQFLDYSATDKHKTVLSRANAATSFVSAVATRWANTSAITSIELDGQSARTLSSGSTFNLYGVAK